MKNSFYNLRMLPIQTNTNNIFKLVNLVLVMMPLTDHVYFVGIVSKNSFNLLQHAMHIAIFSLNCLDVGIP